MKSIKTIADMDNVICISVFSFITLLLLLGSRLSL